MKKLSFLILLLTAVTALWFFFIKDHGLSAREYFKDEAVVSLVRAAYRGDVVEVRKLVNSGVNVNYVGKDNVTPLYWLITESGYANIDAFKELLKSGANPIYDKHKSGRSALLIAARRPSSEYLMAIIESGADINHYHINEPTDPTAIFHALQMHRYENLKLLIKHGANIESKNDAGRTPILEASMIHDWQGVYILLVNGADYNTKDDFGDKFNNNVLSNLEVGGYCDKGKEIDYRKKVVEFLRSKGVTVNLKHPEPEPC